MSLLEVRNLEAFYGPSQALFGVDMTIAEGEAVALLGRNGMGKTTTIRSILGLIRQRRGTIRFSGADVATLSAHRAARLGLGLVPEGRRCFPNLSVVENLLVAARPGDWTQSRVEDLFPRLAERRTQMAATLSGGEQQMLAIGRALMTNPRLLLLDEATEGLAPVVRRDIWQAIGALKASGLSILVVDKSLAELLPVADRCVILERGRSVWSGAPAAIDADLRQTYLGI